MTENPANQDPLADQPFSYRTTKDGKVFIYWNDKLVMTLKGSAAARFVTKISGASDEVAQMIMAKQTGNFKRGNEKLANP